MVHDAALRNLEGSASPNKLAIAREGNRLLLAYATAAERELGAAMQPEVKYSLESLRRFAARCELRLWHTAREFCRR